MSRQGVYRRSSGGWAVRGMRDGVEVHLGGTNSLREALDLAVRVGARTATGEFVPGDQDGVAFTVSDDVDDCYLETIGEPALPQDGEHQLRCAVVAQAIHDVKHGSSCHREDALAWLTSDRVGDGYDFVSLCDVLRLDPRAVREMATRIPPRFARQKVAA